jgi:hypothetical protein
MKPIVQSYVKEEPDDEERTRKVAAILAAGLERLFRNRKEAVKNPDAGLDFPPDLSVTTDCQSNGDAEEG